MQNVTKYCQICYSSYIHKEIHTYLNNSHLSNNEPSGWRPKADKQVISTSSVGPLVCQNKPKMNSTPTCTFGRKCVRSLTNMDQWYSHKVKKVFQIVLHRKKREKWRILSCTPVEMDEISLFLCSSRLLSVNNSTLHLMKEDRPRKN